MGVKTENNSTFKLAKNKTITPSSNTYTQLITTNFIAKIVTQNQNNKNEKKVEIQSQIEAIKATEKFDYDKIYEDILNSEDMAFGIDLDQGHVTKYYKFVFYVYL